MSKLSKRAKHRKALIHQANAKRHKHKIRMQNRPKPETQPGNEMTPKRRAARRL